MKIPNLNGPPCGAHKKAFSTEKHGHQLFLAKVVLITENSVYGYSYLKTIYDYRLLSTRPSNKVSFTILFVSFSGFLTFKCLIEEFCLRCSQSCSTRARICYKRCIAWDLRDLLRAVFYSNKDFFSIVKEVTRQSIKWKNLLLFLTQHA